MKNLMGGLALAVMLFSMPATQAEILLDDFEGNGVKTSFSTANVGTGVVLTTTPSVTAIASASDLGGQDPLGPSTGHGFDLTLGFDPGAFPNPTGFGYFSTLRLDLASVVGNWAVTWSTQNSLGAPTGVSKSTVAIADSSTEAFIDLYDNTHAENLNSLQTLTLHFRNNLDNGGNRVLTIAGISAVPEPASLALLGMTGLGAVALRRRKNQKEA